MKRQRKKVSKLLFILFLFFFAILVVLFFQSSYSKVHTVMVTGTELLQQQEIVTQSGIKEGDQILLIRESKIRNLLLDNPLIKDVHLTIKLPGRVTLQIEEYKRVAYMYNDKHEMYPIMENGYVYAHHTQEWVNYPLISEWNQEELLPNFCKELSQLNMVILQQISEIRHFPSEHDPYKLIVYMRDGFEVQTSIIQFARHLNNYLYVVGNLNKQEPGVIYLSDAGVYYISYKELTDANEENEP